jgi:hypothetical protein
VEEKLTSGLGKGQVAKFIEDDEIHPGQVVGHPALPTGPGLGLKLVDQTDDVEESAPGIRPGCRRGDGNGEMGFTGACTTDEDDIALVAEEVAAGQIMYGPIVWWHGRIRSGRTMVQVLRACRRVSFGPAPGVAVGQSRPIAP